jgi:hypothetical protein
LSFQSWPSPALLSPAAAARLILARKPDRRHDSIEAARPAATRDRSGLGIWFAAQSLGEFLQPLLQRPLDRLLDRPRGFGPDQGPVPAYHLRDLGLIVVFTQDRRFRDERVRHTPPC